MGKAGDREKGKEKIKEEDNQLISVPAELDWETGLAWLYQNQGEQPFSTDPFIEETLLMNGVMGEEAEPATNNLDNSNSTANLLSRHGFLSVENRRVDTKKSQAEEQRSSLFNPHEKW